MWTGFYTKNQLLDIFKSWEVTEQPPKKNGKVVVSFPKGKFNFSLVEVHLHSQKSTYGARLYKVVMLNEEDLKAQIDGNQLQPSAFFGFKRGKRG